MPALSPPAANVSARALNAKERAALGRRWMAAMYRGDFEGAWRETDLLELPRRHAERAGRFRRKPWHLTWDGTPLANCRVLIRCEHGLGDSIQYIRYCAVLQARGCHVTVKAQPHLLALFRHVRGIDCLLNAWTTEPEPEHDVAIECMELAYALRDTTETLPAHVPYIDVSGEAPFTLDAQSDESNQSDGSDKSDFSAALSKNIGLIWAASDWNPRRSIPLAELAPLAGIPGVRLFSLQQGAQRGEAATVGFRVTPLSSKTTEILDAAHAMAALDAIVTVDSMTAHLAGALGRPTFILLTAGADWRWMRTAETSPWYPTARLLRQARAGCWERVIQKLTTAIRVLP